MTEGEGEKMGSRMREDRRGGITPIQTFPRRGGRVKRGGGEDGFPPPAFAGASSRREEKEEGVGGSRTAPTGGVKMGSRMREDRRGGITPIQTFPRRGGRVKRGGGEDGFPPPAFAGASSRREEKEEGVGGSRTAPTGGVKMGSRIREDRRGGITPIVQPGRLVTPKPGTLVTVWRAYAARDRCTHPAARF